MNKLKKQSKSVGMDTQCESMGHSVSNKMPEEKIYRYELQGLERKLAKLEETVNVLTALSDVLTKNMGIKIDKFKGIVVISNI